MRHAPAQRLLLVLLLALSAVFLAGCGSDSPDGDGAKRSGADRAASSEPDTTMPNNGEHATVDAKLEVELEKIASKDFAGIPVPKGVICTRTSPATCSGTIECPAATDDPKGAELCAWLAGEGVRVLTAKEEPGQACTMQYGGPELAHVTGTIGEQEIDATFSRQDGCAINRWDTAAPLWTGDVPPAGPVGTGGGAAGACPALDPDAPVSSDSPDPQDMAADEVCATPATPAPPTGAPPAEPEIISDPPEAFQ